MEERKLCWDSSPYEKKKLVLLTYGNPYEIDYFTSTYFQDVTEIRRAYQEAITNNLEGKIVVYKKIGEKEKKIAPICANHIQYLRQLLSEFRYLQALERMDCYSAYKDRLHYERLFLLDEYSYLRQHSVGLAIESIDEIANIVWNRLMHKQNSYEIIRILLSIKPTDWYKSNVILPSRGEYIKDLGRVQAIARQKQLTPIIERGN